MSFRMSMSMSGHIVRAFVCQVYVLWSSSVHLVFAYSVRQFVRMLTNMLCVTRLYRK